MMIMVMDFIFKFFIEYSKIILQQSAEVWPLRRHLKALSPAHRMNLYLFCSS